MTRLSWSDQNERRYESGIDRGVLYPVTGSGVPWVGLISVTESPTGGESNPFYLDGVRYLDRPGLEEFGATIEAFTYPPEFGECDGTLQLTAGLYAAHQRRKPFGMSYRTRISSAVNLDQGYKLHLIYNAMAEPSELPYHTLGGNADPVSFSWSLSAIPVMMPFAKPTAHLVVNSTEVEPELLDQLENLLYGSAGNDPLLPLPEEVLTLLESGISIGELMVVDMTGGVFSLTGDSATVTELTPDLFRITSPALDPVDADGGTITY